MNRPPYVPGSLAETLPDPIDWQRLADFDDLPDTDRLREAASELEFAIWCLTLPFVAAFAIAALVIELL